MSSDALKVIIARRALQRALGSVSAHNMLFDFKKSAFVLSSGESQVIQDAFFMTPERLEELARLTRGGYIPPSLPACLWSLCAEDNSINIAHELYNLALLCHAERYNCENDDDVDNLSYTIVALLDAYLRTYINYGKPLAVTASRGLIERLSRKLRREEIKAWADEIVPLYKSEHPDLRWMYLWLWLCQGGLVSGLEASAKLTLLGHVRLNFYLSYSVETLNALMPPESSTPICAIIERRPYDLLTKEEALALLLYWTAKSHDQNVDDHVRDLSMAVGMRAIWNRADVIVHAASSDVGRSILAKFIQVEFGMPKLLEALYDVYERTRGDNLVYGRIQRAVEALVDVWSKTVSPEQLSMSDCKSIGSSKQFVSEIVGVRAAGETIDRILSHALDVIQQKQLIALEIAHRVLETKCVQDLACIEPLAESIVLAIEPEKYVASNAQSQELSSCL